MTKKVLIISSSPRRGGNSDRLCDRFLQGAQEAGHQVEKVFLRSLNIHYCTSCGVCNSTHVCTQKDDMTALLDKMVKADVIVLATPVYFYTMSAQLKTLIDRTCPRYTEISHKDFYFIATMADTDESMMERTFDSLRGFTEGCLDDARERGIIRAVGVWKTGEIEGSSYLRQAYEMGHAV